MKKIKQMFNKHKAFFFSQALSMCFFSDMYTGEAVSVAYLDVFIKTLNNIYIYNMQNIKILIQVNYVNSVSTLS
jgi:hypothetical protein